MDRSIGLAWAALAALAAILLVGAALATSALADADAQTAALPAQSDWGHYVAPEDVCPGAQRLDAPVAQQQGTMVCLLNYARKVRGLDPLAPSPVLMRSARMKADDIVRCSQFSHTACGATTVSAFERAGYVSPHETSRYGENLAWGGAEAGSPRGAVLGWLESHAHRANLFLPEWTEQGIALVHAPEFRGVEDSRVWVSHFGHRR